MSKIPNLKLFGKWDFREVEVHDPGLKRYISLNPILIPHSGGHQEHKRFAKAKVNIVERLVNNMMRHGRCGGKKIKAMNIVRNAFEIIWLKTSRNPIEILIRAIENSAPCEDVTRVSYGGIVYYISVDVAPQRRVDLALRFLTEGTRKASFSNPKSIDECLADELILAARRDVKSYAVQKRNEIERVALASR
jgi:small subunit ribosomal protein S7